MSRKGMAGVRKALSTNRYQAEFFVGIGPAEAGRVRIRIGLAAVAIVTLDRAGHKGQVGTPKRVMQRS